MIRLIPSIFILILLCNTAFAECEPLPFDPPGDNHKNTMFFIYKNTNDNVVYYDINFDEDNNVNNKRPVDVYWQMFDEDGQRQELNMFEKRLAYGVTKVREVIPNEKYLFKIVSVKRDIIVTHKDGCFKAETTINGKISTLGKISVYAENTSFLPKVIYIDIIGIDNDTKEIVSERNYHD